MTFVHARNKGEQRRTLWYDLRTITLQMSQPWCFMGDFNSVLATNDRLAGLSVECSDI